MKDRKIEIAVWQGTFEEAEERDNEYWASRTEVERLEALMDLREMFFHNIDETIEKVVFKRSLNEEQD